MTFLFAVTAHAATMYVKSPTADLKSSTDASATVVTQLKSGTKVETLEKQGKWYRVSAVGKQGWIYEFKLSATAPSGGSDFLVALGGGGATAQEGSSAASIRGLSPTSEKYAGRAKITKKEVAMIKHMESIHVPPAEVETFLREGKLGEYGGTP